MSGPGDGGSPSAAPAGRQIRSTKDKATFKPLPRDIDIVALVAERKNFISPSCIDARTLTGENIQNDLRALIQSHVIDGGEPLVIQNYHLIKDWPRWMFNPDWLKENHGKEGWFTSLVEWGTRSLLVGSSGKLP